MTLLEAAFLVQTLPAWSANLAKRMVKSPKILLCDTGLAASQLGLTADRLASDGALFGLLLETFAALELRKAAGGSSQAVQFFHSRTQSGEEVDLVVEDGAGRLVGVEVKAAATVTSSDFRGLRGMAEATEERFRARPRAIYRPAGYSVWGASARRSLQPALALKMPGSTAAGRKHTAA